MKFKITEESPTRQLIVHQTKQFHCCRSHRDRTLLLFISGVSSSLKIQSIIITSPNPCAVQWHDRRVVWPIMDTILSTTQAHIHIKWIRGFSRIWSNNDIYVYVFVFVFFNKKSIRKILLLLIGGSFKVITRSQLGS